MSEVNETKPTVYVCAEDSEIRERVRVAAAWEAEREALGLRAVACKGFRWKEGMLGLSRVRAIWVRVVDPPMDDTSDCFPDLTDSATVGCMLDLVRKAWNSKTVVTRHSEYQYGDQAVGEWDVLIRVEHERVGTFRQFVASTEAEALVKALEFAP